MHTTNVTSIHIINISSDTSKQCCICLSPTSPTTDCWTCDVCHVVIHTRCINQWFHKQHQPPEGANLAINKNTCPMCRTVIHYSQPPRSMQTRETDISLRQEGQSIVYTTLVGLFVMSLFFANIAVLMLILTYIPENSVYQTISIVIFFVMNCMITSAMLKIHTNHTTP